MNKRILGGLAAAAMLTPGFAFTSAGTVSADVVNDGKVCEGLDSTKINTTGDPQTVTIKATDYPAGNLITGYCVKAGSDNQVGGGPVYIKLDMPVATLTFGHPSGKAVSHYSFSFAIPTKAPLVVVSGFVDGAFVCTDKAVTQTRTTTTTTYTWNGTGFSEAVTVTTETQQRPLSTFEMTCPSQVVTPTPPEQASLPPAPATPAPAVSPAAVAPAAAAPAAVVPARGLPSTGIDGTGVTALIALLLTSLGGAALYMSRRYNVTN